MNGCHGCNKSGHEISSSLNIPQSAVDGIIAKCKQLGTISHVVGHIKSQSDQWMLEYIVCRYHQLFAESQATDFQTSCDPQFTSRTAYIKLHGMGFHHEQNAKRLMQSCKTHDHWSLEQWRHVPQRDKSL